jgi:hypothetical protein
MNRVVEGYQKLGFDSQSEPMIGAKMNIACDLMRIQQTSEAIIILENCLEDIASTKDERMQEYSGLLTNLCNAYMQKSNPHLQTNGEYDKEALLKAKLYGQDSEGYLHQEGISI